MFIIDMQQHLFVVKYISVKNCFVYLSEVWLKRFDRKINSIKVSHHGNDYYLSWRPTSGHEESLGISATFARTLNMKEGDEVIVSCLSEPPFLSAITVKPWSAQDWKIVEYQAEKIQSVLLDQISLVAKNQTIVVWISKGLWVTLLIDAINPDFVYGAIGNRTEVHVTQEWAQTNRQLNPKSTTDKKSNLWNIISNIPSPTSASGSKTNGNEESNDIRKWIKENEDSTVPQTFRVHGLSAIKPDTKIIHSVVAGPYDVFVNQWDIPENYSRTTNNSGYRLYKIRKVREDAQLIDMTNPDFLRTEQSLLPKQSLELIVRLFVVEKELKDCSQNSEESVATSVHKKIYVSTNLRRNLKLRIGSKALLEPVNNSEESFSSIEIFPSAVSVNRDAFEEFLFNTAKNESILLNTHSRIYLKDGSSCMVLCSPEECRYAILDSVRLRNVVINVKDVSTSERESSDDIYRELEDINLDTISLRPLASILAECRTVLDLSLGLTDILCGQNSRCDSGNILICGDVGVGKSTFCTVLQADLRTAPNSVHMHVIECKSLKGKKVEAFQKIISAAMSECVYYQPSILFLDDLEMITGAPNDEESTTPDSINSARILDVIFNTAAEYQSSHYVSIIATCANMNKIASKIRSPRGVYLFRTVLTIPDLEKDDRIEVLKLALQSHTQIPNEMNWDYYGNKTEGWVAQDLVDFAEKTAFTAWKRNVKDQTAVLTLIEKDLCDTLEHYKALSLHGVQLYERSDHDWSHIGGLKTVKDMLTQLLQWPLKYPDLYRTAPIKNQNGVLLYGMPGTGKTILAGAVAKQCGLNLISVKGPELLSKYIGASEAAVREIFEKARRAKPCVLFFDEFDSLAPRRGHDSTGVTDRVVNQLLTQLDGVEGREGVAVIAASSRPDLLDPALLRPGRLDKSLLCPLPDEDDRKEILIALCKTQRINTDNLDLTSLAEQSAGFTGADLNATLTQAKYAALEETIASGTSGQFSSTDVIVVTQDHLSESLKTTNPSVSSVEKEKYRKIYGQYAKSNSFDGDSIVKQKATLA